MRILLSTTAIAVVCALGTPAFAMCGGGQSASAASGMCGGVNMGQTPSAAPEQSKPQQSGMCGCCRNMAMMRGGQGGSHMPGMNMPSMEMPKPQ
jgi:hypothetical protein